MPRKKIKKLKTAEKSIEINQFEEEKVSEKQAAAKKFSPYLLIIIALIVVLGLVIYKNKNLFIVGSINNKPITSLELYDQMKKQYGKQILEQLISEKLLVEEADKKNIKVTDAEIKEEIAKIEATLDKTTPLSELLKQRGMTIADLNNQIRLRIIITKLLEDKIKVTDEEVNNYLKENQSLMNKDEDEAKQKEDIRNYLQEQKLNQEIQTLIQDLKSKAKVSLFI